MGAAVTVVALGTLLVTVTPAALTFAAAVPVASLQEPGACQPVPNSGSDAGQVVVVSQVKARYEDALLQIPGVVGTGVGRASDSGELVIQVYVAGRTEQVRQAVPAQLEGIRVELIETGEFTPR
jgi:hypothetical protein